MSNSEVPAVGFEDRFAAMQEFTYEAGELTLRYFQNQGVQVERKGDNSPVTIADKEAELLLKKLIKAKFPDDAVLGEEYGELPGTSGFRWIVDPIDGTKSFISGVPLFGTMVGVEWRERSIMGMVYVAGLREAVYAAAGKGCWHQVNRGEAVRCRVSQRQGLADAIFVTSEVKTFDKRGTPEAYRELERATYVTRTWGDCYGYLLVATGRVDIMVDPLMNVWDAAAIQPIIEEAGGAFTDWAGIPTIYSGEGIATNGLLHKDVIGVTGRYPKK